LTALEFIGFLCAVAIFAVACMVGLFLLVPILSLVFGPIIEVLQ